MGELITRLPELLRSFGTDSHRVASQWCAVVPILGLLMLGKFRHKPAEYRPLWRVNRLFAGWHSFCCVKTSTRIQPGLNQEVPQSQITECSAVNTSVELEHVEPAAAAKPAAAASVILCTNFERGFACLNAISVRWFDRRNSRFYQAYQESS